MYTLSYFVDLLKTPYGREIDMRKLEISWRAYLCVKKSIVDFFFPLFKKPQPSKCYFDGGEECYSTIYSYLKCEKKRTTANIHCIFFLHFFSQTEQQQSRSIEHINKIQMSMLFFSKLIKQSLVHIFLLRLFPPLLIF